MSPAECHYEECHYAECHYEECHYAECRGATYHTNIFLRPTKNEFWQIHSIVLCCVTVDPCEGIRTKP